MSYKNLLKAVDLSRHVTKNLIGYGIKEDWTVKLDKTRSNIELYNTYALKESDGTPDGYIEFKVKIPLDNPKDIKVIPLSNRYKFETRKIDEFLTGLIEIQTFNLQEND